ncbi:MAG: DUF192 domain-containing protein [Patescibacteria group bacterium]|nr:DUF192 domain-containing protein [Patescibacteria group bacterium]
MLIVRAKKLGFLESVAGLMFGFQKPPVYFESRIGIHTFWVFYPIDVIILNRQGIVIKLVESLKPNQILFLGFKSFVALECKSCFIKDNKLKVGDKVIFV